MVERQSDTYYVQKNSKWVPLGYFRIRKKVFVGNSFINLNLIKLFCTIFKFNGFVMGQVKLDLEGNRFLIVAKRFAVGGDRLEPLPTQHSDSLESL